MIISKALPFWWNNCIAITVPTELPQNFPYSCSNYYCYHSAFVCCTLIWTWHLQQWKKNYSINNTLLRKSTVHATLLKVLIHA